MDLVGGAMEPRGGSGTKILYVKMKESGPVGGCAPGTPPPKSANAKFQNMIKRNKCKLFKASSTVTREEKHKYISKTMNSDKVTKTTAFFTDDYKILIQVCFSPSSVALAFDWAYE